MFFIVTPRQMLDITLKVAATGGISSGMPHVPAGLLCLVLCQERAHAGLF
jgi:hypothetical protein